MEKPSKLVLGTVFAAGLIFYAGSEIVKNDRDGFSNQVTDVMDYEFSDIDVGENEVPTQEEIYRMRSVLASHAIFENSGIEILGAFMLQEDTAGMERLTREQVLNLCSSLSDSFNETGNVDFAALWIVFTLAEEDALEGLEEDMIERGISGHIRSYYGMEFGF